MNEIQLSKRLEMVTKEISKGSRIADIGSDHAYLPCYAILNGYADFAIAGEVVEGPYQSACKQVKKCGLENQIIVRKGNGLEAIKIDEVDTITICGMGGSLIREILENGKERLTSVKRLILQPNIGAHQIRDWFIENGWELKKEIIMKEDGKIYEILVGEKGNPINLYSDNKEVEILLGPFLMREKSDIFVEKWQRELNTLEKIKLQIESAEETEENLERLIEINWKINIVMEAIS